MLLQQASRTIRNSIIISMIIGVCGSIVLTQTKPGAFGSLTFSVISVRVMTEKEREKRTLHVIGTDTLVRLRLANEGSPCVFYATYTEAIMPLGYAVMETDTGVFWLSGKDGKRPTSPGWNSASAPEPRWVYLCRGQAVEWENFDATKFAGERHAFTLFVRENETSEPVELFSNFYTVPSLQRKN